MFDDYSMENRTYRYYTGTPYHRFGYGLTYGDCKVVDYKIDNDNLKANIRVKNFGKVSTDDAV